MSFLGLNIPSAFVQVNHKQIQKHIMHLHLHINKFSVTECHTDGSHTAGSYWLDCHGYRPFVC